MLTDQYVIIDAPSAAPREACGVAAPAESSASGRDNAVGLISILYRVPGDTEPMHSDYI